MSNLVKRDGGLNILSDKRVSEHYKNQSIFPRMISKPKVKKILVNSEKVYKF